MSRAVMLTGAILLLSTIPAWAQTKAELDAVNDRFTSAFNKGDAQGVADLFAKDAVLLPDRAPRIDGQEAIAAYWKSGVEAVGNLKIVNRNVIQLGPDVGARLGTWEVTSKGDKPQTFSGKDLLIYRKVGSEWKIVADIWNTDAQ